MVDLPDFWKGFWTGAGVLAALFIVTRVTRII